MNRSKLVVFLLVAIIALAAAVFFWNPAAEPATAASNDGIQDSIPELEPAESKPTELAEAKPEAENSAQQNRTEATSAPPESGLVAQASELGGTYQLRAILEDGSIAAPAMFLIENSEHKIEWIERESGILRLADFSQLRSAAVKANGMWSKPRDFPTEDLQTTVDIAALQQAGSIKLNVSRDGVGIEQNFQCRYEFRDKPMDLATAIASRFDQSPESPDSEPLQSRLFHRAFRVSDFNSDEALGENGIFELTGLPPGNYQFDLRSEFGVPKTKTTPLEAGEALKLDIELETGGWVEGRVLGHDGKPLAEASVLFRASMNSFADAFSQKRIRSQLEAAAALPSQNDRTQTDQAGRYKLGPLPIGEGMAFAGAKDLLPSDAQKVVVDPGQTQELADFHLQKGHNVAVLVTDGVSGEVLTTATVGWNVIGDQLIAFQATEWQDSESDDVDKQGRVLLSNLPFERLGLRVQNPGYAPLESDYLMPEESWDPNSPTPMVSIALRRGSSLRGQVVDAITGVGVSDAKVFAMEASDESLIPGFAQGVSEDRSPSTETDESGRFTIKDLPNGDYTAQVQHEEYAPARSESISLSLDHQPEITIALKPGATLIAHYNGADGTSEANRSIILAHIEMGTTQTKTTDDQGMAFFKQLPAGNFQIATLPGASDPQEMAEGNLDLDFVFAELQEGATKIVELGPGLAQCTLEGIVSRGGVPFEGKSITLLGSSGMKATRSDTDGHFALEGLREGEYSFFAGTAMSPSFSGRVTIVLGSNTLNISLPEGEIIAKVTNADTGEPIAGSPVIVTANDTRGGPLIKMTDSDGIATFPDLADGDYRVSAGAAAMPIFGGDLELGSQIVDASVRNETVNIDIRLTAGATFKARVLGTQGEPVSGASMFYLREDGNPISGVSMKSSNSKGVVQLQGLPAGAGRILVKHPEFGQVEIGVNLVAGDLVKKEIQLQTGTLVYILVTNPSDQPEPGVLAVMEDKRGARISMLYTIPESQAVNQAFFSGQEQKIGPLAAGAYTLKLFRPGGKMQEYKVEIPADTPELHLRYAFTTE